MAKVSVHISQDGKTIQYWFYCPGCKSHHAFTTKSPGFNSPWTFDGNLEAPTFSPSLLCNGDYPESRCHSFVRNGKIEFLGDCFYELKNQTVDLPDADF